MIKSIKAILAQDKEKFKVPRKVQDLIPIKNIWPDGIFKVENKFSKSFRFSDINYLVASREDKESMFLTYSELLNSLDSGATTKITINNHRLNRSDFEESILMPMKQDGLDEYRKEYNDMLLDKATGANGITQEKYITITVAKKDIEEARAYFARIGADLTAHFANLGSKCVPLNAVERLRILHDFYRPGDEAAFSFDMNRKARLGHDFRDYICPDSVERTADHIKLGEKYARVLFLKDYASYIKDSMFSELTELNRNLMLSIDVIPIPTDEAVREVERLLLGVETNITGWQRRQNQNNNFSAVVPYDMELQRKESKEFLDDLTTRDQRMMFAVVTMVITADTKEQLDLDTETVLSTARKHMCQMATLKYQQTDGLNTVLPIGTRKINAFRTLTTESLAVLMPFKVQEIMDKGGIYFGENAISHNLIMCNKANLLNQSAFLLGVPGSGKSFSAKELITFLILNTNDDILICDPEGEYAPLIEAMGDLGSVIRVSAGGRDRLNAMYMVDGYGENNPIVVKSEFIMSLIEQIDKKGVGPQHKSIIDRCITNVYRNAVDTGTIPTLCTLRDMLLEQPEPEAKQIALSLELYTTGSLDIFGKQSNVDLDKRVVVFDIHGLGSQLKPTGLLVITDTMLNRVTLNWKKGKRTHVFIDEFHVVFENEFSAQFFNSAWRQFRKRNAYPTAITQNVEYLLDSVQASTMLSNSEFVVMLNQAASDRGQLAKLLNISNEQMSYITNADAGCGLIKYGSALVPFINRFPRDTKLYQLMTTPPFKGKFEWAIDYYKSMAKKLNITMKLGKEVTAQEVLALKPYSILVATGSNVISIPLEGLDQVQTVQAHDVLANDMQFANKKVVVIGGGITGLETALYINRQGTNQVSVVDMLPEWPVDMLDMRYQNEALLEVRHCNDQGVALFYNNKVVKFADGKLFIESTKDGEVKELPADVIVLSVGVKPNDALWQELLASGHPSVWKAGDAIATGKINKAVLHGSKFGYSLN